jgi:hypothetical protein
MHRRHRPLPRLCIGRALHALVTVAASLCLPPLGEVPARAAESLPTACAESDVWLVSTRRLPGICGIPAHADVDVERKAGGRWESADVESMLADGSRPLVIFIHGNRYEQHDAKAQGAGLARQLSATCPGAAVRTIIFSWPSHQQGHLIPSSRDNYRRCYADGHYLAWLLGRVDPAQPVAIIGYSFGATIAVGAIEDLVRSDGRHGLAPWAGRSGRSHLVLVAPAVRSDALAPRGPYAPVVAGIDRLTLVINSRDLPLRLFPHLDRGEGIDALGVVGMPRRWLPGHVEYTATNAAPIVGRKHSLPLYLESPTLAGRIVAGAVAGLVAE